MSLCLRGFPLAVTVALSLVTSSYGFENQIVRAEGGGYHGGGEHFNTEHFNQPQHLDQGQFYRADQRRMDSNIDQRQLDRAEQLRSEQKTIYDEGYDFESDENTWNAGGTATDPIIVVPNLSNIDNTINE